MLSSLLRDLRYALRALARNPGFTAVSVLALALGIGANSAVFTVLNSVLLRPLNFDKPNQLVWVNERNLKAGLPVFSLSPGNYLDFRDHNRSFSGFMAFQGSGMNLSGGAEPQRLQGLRVTSNFFDVLNVKPLLGRTFTPQEMELGSNRVTILSNGLWQRRYGGSPSALGQTLKLDAEVYTVIGVLPADFNFFGPRDLWTPLAFDQQEWRQRGGHYLAGIARLKDGVSLAAAQADLNTIAARAEQQFPDSNTGWDTISKTLQEQIVGNYRDLMWMLSLVVAVVLLIACVDLANLLLARSVKRAREMGIRNALGAGRGRLIRQLLTESVLLAGIGAGFGLALAWAATQLLIRLAPEALPRAREVAVDWRVVAFTAAVAVATGILFGLAPALDLARSNLATTMREGGRGSSIGFRRNRLRSTLVIGEVALALILLCSSGLLLRSFYRLQSADPGFDAHHVLTFQTNLPEAQYKTNPQQAEFYRRTLDRIRQLPGVSAAGAAQIFPLSGSDYILEFTQPGKPPVPKGREPNAAYYAATPGYLKALRIPVKSGRDFDEHDNSSGAPVAMISESMARKYFPGENPLGQRIKMGNGSKEAEIVGVVGDVRDEELEALGRPAVYEPAAQIPFSSMFFGVRAEGDAAALIPGVRAAVREIDSELPLNDIGTVDALVAKSITLQRFAAMLVAVFAALALVLAMVGIYGVLSYAVTQATQEIGIRMALGARGGDVLRMVAGHAGLLLGAGLAIGMAGAYGVGRLMASDLYEVKAEDPITYSAVALTLLATAAIACAIPALRAMRVNPVVALREE
jgi:putative ABC transport system permease protein